MFVGEESLKNLQEEEKKIAADNLAVAKDMYSAVLNGSLVNPEVNQKFNADLERYKKGELKNNHIFELGKRLDILQSVGIPNNQIELSFRTLAKKLDVHKDITIDDIRNLPNLINNPVMIFKTRDINKPN
ncbi:hypothetical protein KAZ01_02255 [Candidatus Gracilibacteria bacterium]|nr:hypothetical protein [Candidatus Gracilibacteria bacterium]